MIEYKQIPKLENGKCYLCKTHLLQRKSAVVYVYDNKMNFKKTVAELFYCPNCMVQYADSEIFTQIRSNNNGFNAFGFMPNSKLNRASLIKKAMTFPYYCDSSKGTGRPLKGFHIRPMDGNQFITKIYIVSGLSQNCVICNRKLVTQNIPIPISKSCCVYYPVKCCGEHFLIKPSAQMWKLLKRNQYAKHIETNFDYHFNNYSFAYKTFSEDKACSILLLMKPIDKKHRATDELALIIGNKEQIVRSDVMILDYKNDKTRQVLTDVFRHHKKVISYAGVKYRVYYKKTQALHNNLVINKITIQSGGGYYSSLKSSQYQLIDVLMYSPYTQKYEVVHATYDSTESMSYIDISIFRDFVSNYGNPGIELRPYNPNGRYSGEWNEESLLHAYGYTVSQQDNLSDRERCAILAEVIDLELMKPQAIVHFLNGLASIMKGKLYYEAYEKYQRDIQFVKEYKVNPQRFLITGY